MHLHHERFANLHSSSLANRQQRPGFRRRQADRFFAQYVLSRLGGLNRPGHVQMVRQRVVNRFNLAIAQKFLVRPVSLRDAKLLRRFCRAAAIPRSNRRNLAPFAFLHPRDHFAHCDGRRPQHTPPHLAVLLAAQRRHIPSLNLAAVFYHSFHVKSTLQLVPRKTKAVRLLANRLIFTFLTFITCGFYSASPHPSPWILFRQRLLTSSMRSPHAPHIPGPASCAGPKPPAPPAV